MSDRNAAPLEPSDEPATDRTLSTALEHAYYQRDIEALRRIAAKAEHEISRLRALLSQNR